MGELVGIARLFGFRPRRETRAAAALYRCIVEQGRQPGFFAWLGVPDTLDGRFETLALHAFLVLRRLKSDPRGTIGLSQALLDAFFADMDRSLRELGVADLGVGRRVKSMAQALYGRMQAYEKGLEERGDAGLQAALRRNLYGTVPMPRLADLAAMARYVRRQHEALAAQPLSELRAGCVDFLPCEAVQEAEP
jgi:cytochrome b pre-mRNA-processing protein 3